jgi:hypothetical protein
MFSLVIKERNTCTRGVVNVPAPANKNTREACVNFKSMRDAGRLQKFTDRRAQVETMRRLNSREKLCKKPAKCTTAQQKLVKLMRKSSSGSL